MVFLPNVVRAKYDAEFRIRVTFNDGTEASVDFRPWLSGPIVEPIKQVVAWPNGADIAPETLYEAARTTRSDPTLQPR